MRIFFKDIIFVFLLGILILLPFEVWMASQKHVMKAQYSFLQNNCSNVKVLVLGHSQTEAGLNPTLLGDSTYNLAVSGRVIHFDVLLLQRYIDQMDNLQTVIYPMHYSFSGAMRFFSHKGNRESTVHDQVRYLHLFSFRYPMLSLISYSEFLSGNMRLDKVKRLCPPSQNIVDSYSSLGFIPLYGHTSWRNEYDLIQTQQEEFTSDLTTIARLCSEHGVCLKIITCPFSDEALDKVTPEGIHNLQTTIEMVQSLYPDIEWYNYLEDEQFRHDTSLFYDWSHLNYVGSALFSQRVKNDLAL